MKSLDIHSAILARMRERQLNAYKLAKLVDGQVSPASVYAYVAGTRDMTGKYLGHLLDALGLELTER